MSQNLKKLATIGSQLCLEACNVIRQSYQNTSIKKYMKDIDDPVTQADLKIQTMLVRGFGMHFPRLRIVGEQTSQYKGQINIDYNGLANNQSLIPSFVNLDERLSEDDIRNSCLWIDPLDCTRGFLSGHIQDVTVLIGMSIGNKAHFGIVGTPFRKYRGKVQYDPTVTIGSIGCKKTYEYSPYHKDSWKQLKKKSLQQLVKQRGNSKLRIATSSKRPNQKQQKIIESLDGLSIQVGGSGRKIMMVARQQADLLMFIDSPTSLWDSCAGQAIIKSMGGEFVTPYLKTLVYDRTAKDTLNRSGIICALDQNVFGRTLQLLQQFGISKQAPDQHQEIAHNRSELVHQKPLQYQLYQRISKYQHPNYRVTGAQEHKKFLVDTLF